MLPKELLERVLDQDSEIYKRAKICEGRTALTDSRMAFILDEERTDIPYERSIAGFLVVERIFSFFTGREDVYPRPIGTPEKSSKTCSECEGVGKTQDCLQCDGVGEHTCECGSTHECHTCGGKGWIKFNPNKHNANFEDCEECGGSGKIEEWNTFKVGPAVIRGYQIDILQKIEGPVRLYIKSAEDPIFFTFPGGKGALMPITSGE